LQTTEWGIMGLNEPVNGWLKFNKLTLLLKLLSNKLSNSRLAILTDC
jgi:hypothetical protein